MKKCTAFALGCPAMGAEELEDTIVEPFVSEVEKFAAGKRIALFAPMTGAMESGCGSGRTA